MVKYKHFKFFFGGMTIAFQTVPNGVEYGIAYCSKKDQFSRKAGRSLAEHRLQTQEYSLVQVYNGGDVVLLILMDIVALGEHPSSLGRPIKLALANYIISAVC